MTTVLYARVSTADQTIAHQRSHAEAGGFTIDEVIADEGVSGITPASRIGLKAAGSSTSCARATR